MYNAPMNLRCSVTCTGVDSFTDIRALPKGVEYGVLFSNSARNGKRQNSELDLIRIAEELNKHGHKVSIHVCGRDARSEAMNGRLPAASMAQRIQINGHIAEDEVATLCERYSVHTIITQFSDGSKTPRSEVADNHRLLVDASGGRGIIPPKWERPREAKKANGFSGGLSPENMDCELRKIAMVAIDNFWVDMELTLRDGNDKFNPDRIFSIISFFKKQNIVAYQG